MPTKKELLSRPVEHVDPTAFDARPLIDAWRMTAFQARNAARAAEILGRMVHDPECAVILTLAGSLVSAGTKKCLLTLIEHDMVDAIVATGANIVDQDFFEALGFRHYLAPGTPEAPPVPDTTLRDLGIDRIYDTYIDEDELRVCDETCRRIFDSLDPGAYSSRELLDRFGAYLVENHAGAESIVLACHKKRVPIFCPAFSDCSAGFGIVLHQETREPDRRVAIDSGKDFTELTRIKLLSKDTGLFMLGGGVPKNFAQDIVVAAELLLERGLAGETPFEGSEPPMHRYAVQLTVADSRDGALSGSTLREACSWGKVDVVDEQMVFGEATTLLPLLVSDVYHRGAWKQRRERRFADALDRAPARV